MNPRNDSLNTQRNLSFFSVYNKMQRKKSCLSKAHRFSSTFSTNPISHLGSFYSPTLNNWGSDTTRASRHRHKATLRRLWRAFTGCHWLWVWLWRTLDLDSVREHDMIHEKHACRRKCVSMFFFCDDPETRPWDLFLSNQSHLFSILHGKLILQP